MDPQTGMTALGIAFVGLMFGILCLDLVFEFLHMRPLGDWIATWSRRYPLFAASLALIFGAMVGHFFWP